MSNGKEYFFFRLDECYKYVYKSMWLQCFSSLLGILAIFLAVLMLATSCEDFKKRVEEIVDELEKIDAENSFSEDKVYVSIYFHFY